MTDRTDDFRLIAAALPPPTRVPPPKVSEDFLRPHLPLPSRIYPLLYSSTAVFCGGRPTWPSFSKSLPHCSFRARVYTLYNAKGRKHTQHCCNYVVPRVCIIYLHIYEDGTATVVSIISILILIVVQLLVALCNYSSHTQLCTQSASYLRWWVFWTPRQSSSAAV